MKESTRSNDGKIVGTDYTRTRDDGKTETRQVDRNGNYTGRNVSDKDGHTDHYDKYGNKTN